MRPSAFPEAEQYLHTSRGELFAPLPKLSCDNVRLHHVHEVRYSDLDVNNHVNNVRAVELISDALDLYKMCIRDRDNHMQQGNLLNIDPRRIVFTRVMDMNDRALRNITIGLGGKVNGVPREDHFMITVASEVMAILCLAADLDDLKKRFGDILVAYSYTCLLYTSSHPW